GHTGWGSFWRHGLFRDRKVAAGLDNGTTPTALRGRMPVAFSLTGRAASGTFPLSQRAGCPVGLSRPSPGSRPARPPSAPPKSAALQSAARGAASSPSSSAHRTEEQAARPVRAGLALYILAARGLDVLAIVLALALAALARHT